PGGHAPAPPSRRRRRDADQAARPRRDRARRQPTPCAPRRFIAQTLAEPPPPAQLEPRAPEPPRGRQPTGLTSGWIRLSRVRQSRPENSSLITIPVAASSAPA